MATSRIISMHTNMGKTIAQCLADRIDYSKNPDKTNDAQFVTSYGCNASIADAEFLFSKRQYEAITGRRQKNDVIAYQIRQSFKPGEISPELANKIAYDLAMKLTKGNHAFLVCTHTDKKHIHSHIIFNSTALDCTRKFRDFLGSGMAIRRISDRLCLEHGLSVIADPKPGKSHYGQWLGNGKIPSFQERLRTAIDAALKERPTDYDAFLALMKQAGYEYKPGKSPGFRYKGPPREPNDNGSRGERRSSVMSELSPSGESEGYGACDAVQKHCTRLRSLKDGYSEDEIRAVIAGAKEHTPRKTRTPKKEAPRVNLLVDIQTKLQAGKGAGYERWAKVFNLKQMAQTLNFLQDHNLLEYDALAAKTAELTARFDVLSGEIKAAEKRMAEIAVLKTHIINYSKTRNIYIAYRKAGYSKKFLAAHEGDIILHKAAKKAFDDAGLTKLPTVKALQAEYAELLSAKKRVYGEFVNVRAEKREALTAKANVDRLLGHDAARPDPEKDRGER